MCCHLTLELRTLRLESDMNWQVPPSPSVAAESAEKTASHETAANVPLISCEDALPVNSTVI